MPYRFGSASAGPEKSIDMKKNVPTEAAVSRRLKSVVLRLSDSASRRLHKDILGLGLSR